MNFGVIALRAATPHHSVGNRGAASTHLLPGRIYEPGNRTYTYIRVRVSSGQP
jgi:hypothetical protein